MWAKGFAHVLFSTPTKSIHGERMKANFKRSCVIAAAMMLCAATSSAATSGAQAAPVAKSLKTTLTANERGQFAGQFVQKWGVYVTQVYGIDVNSWAQRMVAIFVNADAVNFQRALQRSTYEGAMATLDGAGHKLSDDKVITTLAKSSGTTITPAALGETTKDLVFTAVEPCRIVDTRGTGAGAIAGGTSRAFYAWGFSSFASQGGSATDCGGFLNQSPEAIVVNLTAVAPAQTGYATLFPANGTQPLAASLIYQAGQVLSNAVVVKLGTTGAVDFKIFSEKNADYVVDIVGYYDAPYATALDCVNVFNDTATVVPVGGFTSVPDANIAACPATYNGVAYVWEYQSGTGGISVWNNVYGTTIGLSHAPYNGGGTNMSLEMGRRCCRVPGR